MHPSIDSAINYIKYLKRINKYNGERIGVVAQDLFAGDILGYKIGDIVIFIEENGSFTINPTTKYNDRKLEYREGIRFIQVPKVYLNEYEDVPKGLYDKSGIGRILLASIDFLANNNHREAAFVLLLTVVASLSRRRNPLPKDNEGLVDKAAVRNRKGSNAYDGDKVAFTTFLDTELERYAKQHPELGLDNNNIDFMTAWSNRKSVGEWIYDYYRNTLIHNSEPSLAYRIEFDCPVLLSTHVNKDTNDESHSIGWGYFILLRELVEYADENDESF